MHGFSWVIEDRLAGMGRPGGGAWQALSAGQPPGVLLAEDLARLKRAGIRAVVTLTEAPLDESVVREAGFGYLHLPVLDMTAPSPEDVERFVAFAAASIGEGRPVAVHCAAGLGRTGTMLACYLVKEGHSAQEAIRQVRALRPGSIETQAQEEAVLGYARRLAEEAR